MSDRIAELRRLLAEASPGPWKVCRGGGHQHPYIESAEPLPWNGTGGCSWATMILESRCDLDLPGPKATLALVVEMHSALPLLLDAVEAARASRAPCSCAFNDEGRLELECESCGAETDLTAALARLDGGR